MRNECEHIFLIAGKKKKEKKDRKEKDKRESSK